MMRAERIKFPGAFGDSLAARLERPDGEALAFALFAHCFTCSKDLKSVRRISRFLVEEGIGVFTFDFTGLGESEGDFADTSFSSNLEDLVAAAGYLREEHRAPEILVGHSLGGAAVLAAAGRIPESRAVATLAAPSETSHLVHALGSAARRAEAGGEAEAEIGGRTFRIRRQLVEDLREQNLRDAIAGLGKPLLIFHSPVDRVVPIDHARKIYEAAKHPKSFVSLDGADHLLLKDPRDSQLVGKLLAAWAGRYVAEDAR
jgi:putative redox protein